jgi:hypothetical protein
MEAYRREQAAKRLQTTAMAWDEIPDDSPNKRLMIAGARERLRMVRPKEAGSSGQRRQGT